ncbi:LOW QUALITY PROTEIN: uncharacterized protein lawc [Drosophila takahashii]|uniref:LOW QUALITY PROTEIN: uncharacterized protein lawc n=1 Tax=Drosophila takahashii TaxID=29030 RepID=UPI0038990B2A
MLSPPHTRFLPLCGAARVLSQQQTRNKSSKTVEVYRDASKNLSFDVVAVRCSSCCCCCVPRISCAFIYICTHIYMCTYMTSQELLTSLNPTNAIRSLRFV